MKKVFEQRHDINELLDSPTLWWELKDSDLREYLAFRTWNALSAANRDLWIDAKPPDLYFPLQANEPYRLTTEIVEEEIVMKLWYTEIDDGST